MSFYNPSKELKSKIMKMGGFVNCHAHLDRAYTVASENLNNECEKFLTEKWKIVDKVKRESSEEEIYDRMRFALVSQHMLGVSSICSFIDVDSVIELKAIKAAARLRADMAPVIDFKIACQTLKGVTDSSERKLLESVLEEFDVIGSLPAADNNILKHLDVVMCWARDLNKKLHVHVDQLNRASEDETSLVLDMISNYGLEGKVVGVHGISIASKPKTKREEIYLKCKDKGMSFIACPSAWIDHRRSEELQPWHNATTPVEEMLYHNINVGLGTDNICDIYKPFSDGNMMTELKFILESCHIYDYNKLVGIATNNSLV